MGNYPPPQDRFKEGPNVGGALIFLFAMVFAFSLFSHC